jgi:hypothetical protein
MSAEAELNLLSRKTAELATQARALVNALDRNVDGTMVAGQHMGGDGGLVTTDTLIERDKLRAILEEIGA